MASFVIVLSYITPEPNNLLVTFNVSSLFTKVSIPNSVAIIEHISALDDKFSELLLLVEKCLIFSLCLCIPSLPKPFTSFRNRSIGIFFPQTLGLFIVCSYGSLLSFFEHLNSQTPRHSMQA